MFSIRLQSKKPEPYWFLIIPLLIAGILLYGWHLATGITPDKRAFTIFQIDVYWYGIIITGGIFLGGLVTHRLARRRAERLLAEAVPAGIRQKSVDELPFPAEIHALLDKRRVHTVGDLLLRHAWGPALGLNNHGRETVDTQLREVPEIDSMWLDAPPWQPWNPDHVWGIGMWGLILGVIGARLYHVFTPSPSLSAVDIQGPLDYFRHPLQLINLRNGGLGIYGGLLGGLAGLAIYAYRQKISFIGWADLLAPAVALGQAIGRWGNFLNQELYGRPTSLPWAVFIEPAERLPGYTQFSTFHPTFLYESLWSLGLFLLLLRLFRRTDGRLPAGTLTATYLLGYAAGRFLLEFVRLDSRTIGATPISVAMVVSAGVAVAAGIFLWWRRRTAA